MGRIFNIYFQHEGHPYSALVTVAGEHGGTDISVNTSNGQIQIQLPNGRLIFPISEVLHRVTASTLRGGESNGIVRITNAISLQLMNAGW